ncbi:MAG: ArnT family glycosyltransferase [Armatimonadota bacterium]
MRDRPLRQQATEATDSEPGLSLMPVIGAILGAAVAVQVIIFLLHAYQAITFPYQLDYGEGPILQIALEVARGRPMYPPVAQPPYIIASYEPAYYLVSALGVKLFGVGFWWGRLVSTLSVLATALFAALIVWDCTKHRLASFIAGGTVLAMPHFMVWATLMRVDAMALALATAGFWLLTRGARWAAVPLFSLGVFTRRTTVAAMGAAFIGEAGKRGLGKAAKVLALQVALIVALLVGANLVTRGGMYAQLKLHTATSLGKAWSWQQLWSLLWVPGNPSPLKLWPAYFAMTLIAAIWSTFHRESRLLLLWFLLSCVIFLTSGRIGSAHNYLMEPTAVGAMMFGVMYGVMSGAVGRGVRAGPECGRGEPRAGPRVLLMLLAGALAAQMVWTTQHLPETLSILQPRVDARASQRIIELARQTDGPALVEDTGLSLLAGKEPPLMPFEFTMMARARALDPEPVYRVVREGRYPLIVLRFNPFDPLEVKLHRPGTDWKGGRWPDGIIAGVQARYRLAEETGPYFVFTPR